MGVTKINEGYWHLEIKYDKGRTKDAVLNPVLCWSISTHSMIQVKQIQVKIVTSHHNTPLQSIIALCEKIKHKLIVVSFCFKAITSFQITSLDHTFWK